MKPLEKAETQLRNKLESEGWKVVHKGWPDFACVRGDEVIFIEVKSYRGEMLKKEQHYMMKTLTGLGLKCYKWTPDGGFEETTVSTPLPRGRLTFKEKIALFTPEERRQFEIDKANGKEWYL